jgi:pimeloyl-ACP methyl ester carboxylesterase
MPSPMLTQGAALLLVALAACAPEPVERVPIPDDDIVSPFARGPWLVHERALAGGAGTLYVPSVTTEDVFPLRGRPLVVFTAGFSASEDQYASTLRWMAAHGLLVLGANHGFSIPSALTCLTQQSGFDAVTEVLADVRALSHVGGELPGLIDLDAGIATMGHSYGGKLALWRAALDDEVRAVVALDPVDGGDERRAGWCDSSDEGYPPLASLYDGRPLSPTLMLSAGQAGECAPEEGNAFAISAQLGSPALHLALPRAGHQDFLDAAADDGCVACWLCPASGEDAADVQRLTQAWSVAFVKTVLLGDERYQRYLDRREGEVAVAVIAR